MNIDDIAVTELIIKVGEELAKEYSREEKQKSRNEKQENLIYLASSPKQPDIKNSFTLDEYVELMYQTIALYNNISANFRMEMNKYLKSLILSNVKRNNKTMIVSLGSNLLGEKLKQTAIINYTVGVHGKTGMCSVSNTYICSDIVTDSDGNLKFNNVALVNNQPKEKGIDAVYFIPANKQVSSPSDSTVKTNRKGLKAESLSDFVNVCKGGNNVNKTKNNISKK